MEFKEAMEKRHSVRRFAEDEVPGEVLRGIVRTAQRTPSWENSQPWNVYIATGRTLAKIKEVWAAKYGTIMVSRSMRAWRLPTFDEFYIGVSWNEPSV